MARTRQQSIWQHPRWRRLLMQSAMWVILAGTVGLAAMIDRHKQLAREVPLGPLLDCGSVALRIPAGWTVRTDMQQMGMINARGPVCTAVAMHAHGYRHRRRVQ